MSDLVDIVQTAAGSRPIAIYDAVRQYTALNIKETRKLVDAPPQAIITQVPREQAEAIVTELKVTGASFELRDAGAPGAPTDLL